MDSKAWFIWIIFLPSAAFVAVHIIWLSLLSRRIRSFRPVTATLIRALMPRHLPGRKFGIKAIDEKIEKSLRYTMLLAEYSYTVDGKSFTSQSVIPGEITSGFLTNFDAAVAQKLKVAAVGSKTLIAYHDPSVPHRAYLTNSIPASDFIKAFFVLFFELGFLAFSFTLIHPSPQMLAVSAVWMPAGAFLLWRLNAWLHRRKWQWKSDIKLGV